MWISQLSGTFGGDKAVLELESLIKAEQCFRRTCLASQRLRVSGACCCSVEIIKTTAVIKVKKCVFLGKRGECILLPDPD